MVLGKFPVPGRPSSLEKVGQGPTALAVGAGGGCLDIFTLIYLFSFLSPSLWETTRYRLKYCLKGLLSSKTTNNYSRLDLIGWLFGVKRPFVTVFQSISGRLPPPLPPPPQNKREKKEKR